MKSGIYKIAINNKVYVGFSKNLIERRAKHLRALRLGVHVNVYLQRAYDKYGECEWSVLEKCDVSLLESREEYWMKVLDSSSRGKGYNIAPAGVGGDRISSLSEKGKKAFINKMRQHMLSDKNPTKGKPRSQEVKDQISKVRKEKGLAKGANNCKWKGVEDETLIEAHNRLGSYAEVGREVGLTRSQVRQRILKYKGEWL